MARRTVKNAAKILGMLSGVKRGSPPSPKLLRLTNKQKHDAAVTVGSRGAKWGRIGGLLGGKAGARARNRSLDARARSLMATRAARARWGLPKEF